jgi:hypothetical protein
MPPKDPLERFQLQLQEMCENYRAELGPEQVEIVLDAQAQVEREERDERDVPR